MKTILYPDPFLCNKIQRKSNLKPLEADHACLLKYFPKYYNNLRISLKPGHPKSFQSRVKQLKIIRRFSCHETPWCHDKTLRRLFRSSRKTLKKIPSACQSMNYQDISLCEYFIRVNTLNISYQSHLQCTDVGQVVETSFLKDKNIYSSYGYFWIGNRFVKNLEVTYFNDDDLTIIKRLESSKRFLSNLRNLQLNFSTQDTMGAPEYFLEKLLTNKEFLKHITNLDLQSFPELTIYWDLVQLLIDSCENLDEISVEINDSNRPGFCLDLSYIQSLQVLKMNVGHFMTLIKGLIFPSSLKEISLTLVDTETPGNLKGLFECQENKEDDVKDWESFEKHRIFGDFLEKWRKFEKLRVLNLNLQIISDINILVKNFILPLLGRIPQLENFAFDFYSPPERDGKFFDLEMLLKGIEPMKALKSLKISTDFRYDCRFENLITDDLSNLSELEIDVKIFSLNFDLKRFLNAFLWRKDDFENKKKKILKLGKIFIFSVQDLLRFINDLRHHSVADFKNLLQFELKIYLFVENLSDISWNIKYPIVRVENILLRVDIFLKGFFGRGMLSLEEKQSLERIFGEIMFTVSKARKCDYRTLAYDPHYLVEEKLM